MRSKSSNWYINACRFNALIEDSNSCVDGEFVRSEYAIRAIEKAESELLETHVSREKILEALKETCFFRDAEKCQISPVYSDELDDYTPASNCYVACVQCHVVRNFTEKLNELTNK